MKPRMTDNPVEHVRTMSDLHGGRGMKPRMTRRWRCCRSWVAAFNEAGA